MCTMHFSLTCFMSSRVNISGESPPCTHRNCWFIKAARGRQSNESIHTSYTVSVYLVLPVCVCVCGYVCACMVHVLVQEHVLLTCVNHLNCVQYVLMYMYCVTTCLYSSSSVQLLVVTTVYSEHKHYFLYSCTC